MEFVDQIQKGDEADNGIVPEDKRDKIIKMQVAADAK
jgi:hypothetical protein